MRVTHRATVMADEGADRVSDASKKFYEDAYRMEHLPMEDFRSVLNNRKVRDAYQNLKGDMDIMVQTEPGAPGISKMLDWDEFIKSESVSLKIGSRI